MTGRPVAHRVAGSLRRTRVARWPHREQVRFRRQTLLTLVLTLILGAVLAAYATVSQRAVFMPVVVAFAMIALVGGVVGLWRLVAAWEAGPSRSHAVLAAFSLGLANWAVSTLVYLVGLARGAPLVEFPSLIDVPNYLSVLCWTIGVWLLYEDGVDDYLDEIKENSYFLTLIAVLVFFVLTVAEGNDYGALLWSGDQLAKHVTEGLLPLLTAINGFFLFRAARGQLGKRLRVERTALQALAFGLMLTAVADLLVAAGASIGARDPTSPFAYRNGGLADTLTLVAYFWLSFGLLHFPLDAPLFHPGEAQAGTDPASNRA